MHGKFHPYTFGRHTLRTCRIRALTLLLAEGTQADTTRDRYYQPHQCTTPKKHVAVAAGAAAVAAEAKAAAALRLHTAAAADADADNSGLHPSVAAVAHQSHTADAAIARHLHTVVSAAPPYQASPPFAAYYHSCPLPVSALL